MEISGTLRYRDQRAALQGFPTAFGRGGWDQGTRFACKLEGFISLTLKTKKMMDK
jgi:hypothetical protein